MAKSTELAEGTMLKTDSDYQTPGQETECATMVLVAVAAAAKILGHAQFVVFRAGVIGLYGDVSLYSKQKTQKLVSCEVAYKVMKNQLGAYYFPGQLTYLGVVSLVFFLQLLKLIFAPDCALRSTMSIL